MNTRWIGITFIGACIIVGLITGLFSRSIEAALTLPLSVRVSQVTATPTKTTPIFPIGTAQPTTQSTPTTGGVTNLAQDTFKRANQVFWGTASDGRQWTGDANSIEVFSVVGNAGQIDHAQGTFNAILGPVTTNAEVVFSGTVNQFTTDAAVNMGAVLRWTDDNNWYKALINGSNLQILRCVNGKTTSLGSVPFSAQGGTSYTLRFPGSWRCSLRQSVAEQPARTKRLDAVCDGYRARTGLWWLALLDAKRRGHQGKFLSRDNSNGLDLGHPSYHMKAERYDERHTRTVAGHIHGQRLDQNSCAFRTDFE